MKIVHCIFSYNIGGSESMLNDIVEAQSKDNDVTLIIVNNDYNEDLLAKIPSQVKVIRLNRQPGSRNILHFARLNWTLLHIKPDIIHIHSFELAKVIFYGRNKLWFTAHCLDIPMIYSDKLHGLIAISQAVKDNIVGRSKCKNVVVIPNGIDIEEIAPKTSNGIRDRAFRIVQVGRINHTIKGQDILIEAVSRLKAQCIDNISVDFIGEGPEMSYLKNLSEQLGVSSNINFLGLKDREYIYTHLRDYDLMCHPARQEGFGLVVAEGMAAGIPVLVPDEGGPCEVTNANEFGTTFATGNAADLADKIKYMMENFEEFTSKAVAARRHVIANYSVSAMVQKYLKAYREQ